MAKTNSEIIRENVQQFFTPEQIHTLAAAHFSAETIAARAAAIKVLDDDGNELDPVPFAELDMVVEQLHTFQGWKQRGLSVKKGEKAVFGCYLWRWTDKPNAAARKAAEEAGEELNPDPHYYKTMSYLFFIDQVERRPEKAAATKKPAGSMAEYNRYLSAQRKAGNKNPLSFSAWSEQQTPAEQPAKSQPTAAKPANKPTAKPAKKATAKKAAPPAELSPAVVAVEHHDLHPAPAAEDLDFAALAASIIF